MNTQAPLNPQDRLKAMLSGAKRTMDKVESGDYSTGNINQEILQQTSDGLLESHAVPPQHHYNAPAPTYNTGGSPVNYNTSKMPQAIKEAMLNSPQAPVWNPSATFELADVADLIEKPIVNPQYRQPAPRQQAPVQQQQYYPPQIIEQQYQQPPAGMMMVNETQLRQMMKDFMMDFMANTFTKSLSEEVIKKTIGTLIKEGKITVKTQPAVKK